MADYNHVLGDDDCPPWLTATQETECHPKQVISSILQTHVPTGDYPYEFVHKHSTVYKLVQGAHVDKALFSG